MLYCWFGVGNNEYCPCVMWIGYEPVLGPSQSKRDPNDGLSLGVPLKRPEKGAEPQQKHSSNLNAGFTAHFGEKPVGPRNPAVSFWVSKTGLNIRRPVAA